MDEDDNYQDKRCQAHLAGHNTKTASMKEKNFQYKN